MTEARQVATGIFLIFIAATLFLSYDIDHQSVSRGGVDLLTSRHYTTTERWDDITICFLGAEIAKAKVMEGQEAPQGIFFIVAKNKVSFALGLLCSGIAFVLLLPNRKASVAGSTGQ